MFQDYSIRTSSDCAQQLACALSGEFDNVRTCKMIDQIVKSSSPETLSGALLIKPSMGVEVLMFACFKSTDSGDSLTPLIEKLSAETLSTLLLKHDTSTPPLLTCLSEYASPGSFIALIEKLSPETLSTLLLMKNLHDTAQKLRPVAFIALIKKLTDKTLSAVLPIQGHRDNTPLHLAAQYTSTDAFIAFVEKASSEALSAALPKRNDLRQTPFHLAAAKQSAAALIALMEKASPNSISATLQVEDRWHKTPIDTLLMPPINRTILNHRIINNFWLEVTGTQAFNRYSDRLLKLLDAGEEYLAAPLIQHDQNTLLIAAVNNKYTNALRILLSHNLDPNQTLVEGGTHWTPLIRAIYDHKFEMAIMMVKSPRFTYNSPAGRAAWVAARAVGSVKDCHELIALLDTKKKNHEDDLLWEHLDETPNHPAKHQDIATATPLRISAPPPRLKSVDGKLLVLKEQEEKFSQPGALYEL